MFAVIDWNNVLTAIGTIVTGIAALVAALKATQANGNAKAATDKATEAVSVGKSNGIEAANAHNELKAIVASTSTPAADGVDSYDHGSSVRPTIPPASTIPPPSLPSTDGV